LHWEVAAGEKSFGRNGDLETRGELDMFVEEIEEPEVGMLRLAMERLEEEVEEEGPKAYIDLRKDWKIRTGNPSAYESDTTVSDITTTMITAGKQIKRPRDKERGNQRA